MTDATNLALPALLDLPARPKRVVWHWTAGDHFASRRELLCYHILIEHHHGASSLPHDDGVAFRRGVPIQRNMCTVSGPSAKHKPDSGYAAHLAGLNSYSIGVSLCGMRGAVDYRPDSPVLPGSAPVTLLQYRALLAVSAQLAQLYELEVSERTFFAHYEVQRIYGVALTPGRWDTSWIPGFGVERESVGAVLRSELARWLRGDRIDPRFYDPPVGSSSLDISQGEED